MKSIAVAVLLLVVTGLSACGLRAMEDQVVFLDPAVSITKIDHGNGRPISVEVVDERDQVSIGHRYWAYGEAAKITTGQDVAELIRTEVVSALNSYSFEPVTAGENIPLSLKIEVRRLEYRGSQEFTFGLHVFVTLKANARNGDKIYEKLYRVEKEDRVMIVADEETNARLINATLSDAISQMVNDSELLAFLAQEPIG